MIMKVLDQVNESRMEKALDRAGIWKEEIDKVLEKEFEEHLEETSKIDPRTEQVAKYLKDYTMRAGKRLRPIFTIAGYLAVGGEEENNIISTSSFIELSHTYILLHDDVIDEDNLRRGGLSFHKQFEAQHGEESLQGDSERFGINMATNAGDLADSYSLKKLMEAPFPAKVRIEALEKLQEIYRHTGFGEALELLAEHKPLEEIIEDEILKNHALKTAQYTVAGPLEIGCIFGRGDEEQKEVLKEYGMKVGKAYQLYDDILSLFGEEGDTGKPVGSDLEQGKRTLLILKAIENSEEEERKFLKEVLGKDNINEQELEKSKEIVKASGSLEYCRSRVRELIEDGKEDLRSSSKIEEEARDLLLGLADYVVTRDR